MANVTGNIVCFCATNGPCRCIATAQNTTHSWAVTSNQYPARRRMNRHERRARAARARRR